MPTPPRLRHVEGPFLGAEAIANGLLTTRTLRGPAVRRLFRGVYVPTGVFVDHLLRVQGAALLAPPGTAVSHRSAAAVHGCDLARSGDPVCFCVGEAERFGPVRGTLVRRTTLLPGDTVPWGGIRVTTPLRTAIDLAGTGPLPEAVADLDALLRCIRVSPDAVERALRGRRHHGVVQAREAVRLADPRAESRPESILRCHLNLAGLWPLPQLKIRLRDGSKVRVDLGFERERVAVEYDGAWHALREQLRVDRARMGAFRRAGWTTVHVTDQMLAGGAQAVVREVAGALSESRWAA